MSNDRGHGVRTGIVVRADRLCRAGLQAAVRVADKGELDISARDCGQVKGGRVQRQPPDGEVEGPGTGARSVLAPTESDNAKSFVNV